MNISLKFHKDPSFRCGDICKTVLTFKSHQFSMYFPYFHSYTPQKSSKMDNYWTVMEFFGNYLSKCTYVMVKKTPVSVYRLLSSPSNKRIVLVSFQKTPCNIEHTTHDWLKMIIFISYDPCYTSFDSSPYLDQRPGLGVRRMTGEKISEVCSRISLVDTR